MKYQIVVNQAGVVSAGLHLKTDLVDWAILAHVYAWQANSRATRKDDKVWISYTNIMTELPLLGLNSKGAVSRRIRDLKELGLIEVEQVEDGRLFVKTTDLYESIQEYKTRSRRATGGVHQNEQVPDTDELAQEYEAGSVRQTGGVHDGEQGVRQNERGVHDGEQGPVHDGEPISNNNSHPLTKSKGADAPAPPDGLNLEAWNLWIEFRRTQKFKTYKTIDTAVKLARYPPEVQMTAVRHSIENCYQGLFPEKFGGDHSDDKQPGKDTALQQVQKAFAGLTPGADGLGSGGRDLQREVDQDARRRPGR